MRTALVLAIVLVLVPVAHAERLTSYTVAVAAPRYSFVAAGDLLIALCGPQTEGCTYIKGASFSASCVPDGDAWRMAPAVSFIPYVYIGISVRRDHIIEHELTHIDDVQRSMERYARDVAAARYPSLDQCRESAAFERGRIEDLARSYAQKSFEVRR